MMRTGSFIGLLRRTPFILELDLTITKYLKPFAFHARKFWKVILSDIASYHRPTWCQISCEGINWTFLLKKSKYLFPKKWTIKNPKI